MGLFQSSEIENEEQLIEVCQRGLGISCIILLHYREHIHIPSFSNALSQAVIWPGQDLAGKVEKGWVNGRKQMLLATGRRFLWTIHTKGLTAAGKIHVFSRRCVPI